MATRRVAPTDRIDWKRFWFSLSKPAALFHPFAESDNGSTNPAKKPKSPLP
jgi:hypothetical protein